MQHKLMESPGKLVCAPEMKQSALAMAWSGQGEFEGYASLFNIADLGKDVVMPGAFASTLQNRGARGIKMLWQHKASEPIGVWLSIVEDSRGLRVKGCLNLDVARAREVYSLIKQGAADGLSIGFRAGKAIRDRKTGLRHLEKIDLWEISVVTFPMLPQARVNAVKRGPISGCGSVNRSETAASALRRALHQAQNFMH